MKYRLGLDIGSTSLGWCVLALDKDGRPHALVDMGVRIFPDGRDDKSKEPLAVARRNARGMRRNLDRRDLRQKRLMKALIRYGLMPQDEEARKALETLDPYELRAEALHGKISPHHLGRALFHINQRRGFKSNRKTAARENEAGNMKTAIADLDGRIMASGSKTLGEYLWMQKQESQPVRVRTRMVKNKAEYNFYPGREMYVKEVDAILSAQVKHHPELTDAAQEELKDIIFYQRPLKPPVVGKCRFENDALRIRKAHPLFQKFRILQDVNHLELDAYTEGDPSLLAEDRQKIVTALGDVRKLTFSKIRTLLKLGRSCKFNMETEARGELRGDDTAAILSDDKCFGERWKKLPVEAQEKIIALVFDEQDADELVFRLMADWDLDRDQAENVAAAHLEDGYASLSRKAIENILPGLEEGLTYDKAVKKAYPHHSDFRTGEVFERLPYYGEVLPASVIGGSYETKDADRPERFFGKINNPSVHIALNQVRKLVNAVIDRHGQPWEIVVELTRDLKEPVDDIKKFQSESKKDNDRINKELEKLGQRQNYRNRMLYKLWEDLAKDPAKRCCPFTGVQIAASDIFTGEFEEEHLLPFSRSFNDGRANKVLSSRTANREKGNKTPFEAFAGDAKRWNEILARVENLPSGKQWRFKEDAWEIAKGKGEDVIARMLNDTRYMSKVARQYLSAVFDNEKGKSRVYAIPGQMTALMRDKWGLNNLVADVWKRHLDKIFPDKPAVVDNLIGEDDSQKNRGHHLHHAIDAFVVGCTDRGMLKRVSDAAHSLETKKELRDKRRKLVEDMPEPFEGFRSQIVGKLGNTVISYKPDHGGAGRAVHASHPYTVAALHEQTAYGLIGEGKKKGALVVATRKPVDSFTKLKQLEDIADPAIREDMKEALDGVKEGSAEWKSALAEFAETHGMRRVRVHIEKSANVMIDVKQPKDRGPHKTRGKAYKFYALGGNDHADIWCTDKGKDAGKWQCEVISNYHAHKKDFMPDWRRNNPTARLVMRLHINDMVAYEENGITKINKVKKMTGGLVYLRDHSIAVESADKLSWAASAGLLQNKNARKISVDILGRVKDPMYAKPKTSTGL
jgi:CRISPR-associated endonuclease Csn1